MTHSIIAYKAGGQQKLYYRGHSTNLTTCKNANITYTSILNCPILCISRFGLDNRMEEMVSHLDGLTENTQFHGLFQRVIPSPC
jgi:hypothetical protein